MVIVFHPLSKNKSRGYSRGVKTIKKPQEEFPAAKKHKKAAGKPILPAAFIVFIKIQSP